ncbi:TetR family transcriptional regulator, partial [Streptomyces sp. SID5926]|nr:TetR family transcriptional regulator [Streptomyces sp. SID5926]
MAAEADLADAIALRLRGDGDPGGDEPGLYPRLLAAVAGAAVRTSMDHWSAHQEEAAFLDVFHEVFTLLAAGLPAPSA